MKKKFRFSKNINTVYFPFLLNDLTPWQDQVKYEIDKLKEEYIFSKKHKIGYCITDICSEIIISK